MLGLRKPNFQTKYIPFEKSHNVENCKRRIEIFQHPFCCKISKKMQGNPLESLKNFRKKYKKQRIFNSLIVPKNLKEGTLCDFLTFVLLQNIKTNWREDALRTFFGKKSLTKPKKGRSLIMPKVWEPSASEYFEKKLAHTHGFEHGLKSKHLTTRPRTPELCDLRAETRELSRGKKASALSHNNCLLQVQKSLQKVLWIDFWNAFEKWKRSV